jgi:pilus assembly protein FimV
MKPKQTLKRWLIAGALFAMPWASFAAGLGNITVISALGQPLRAEIDLIAVPKDEVDLLVPRIAPAEEYRRAGLERPEGAGALRLAVEKRPNGQPYLKVTSTQPINEPFLQLLIQLDWPGGRIFRGYTVLLDPPGLQERPAVATVTPPIPAAAPVAREAAAAPVAAPKPEPAAVAEKPSRGKAAARVPEPKPAPAKPEVLVKAVPPAPLTPAEQTFPHFEGEREVTPSATPAPAAVAPVAEQKTYRVKPGDTLAKIAQSVKPEGVSLEQMLVALFEANRQAFEGNNMNRLRSGQILRVPAAEEATAVSRTEAARQVKAHAADWNAYRQKLAAAAASQPAESGQEASGRITTKVEEKAPEAKEPKDVLKLSQGEVPTGKGAVGAKGSAEGKALQDKLNAALEEAAAKEKALKEANSRIAELEKNIQDMKRLLEAQNQQLAELQKLAAASKAQAAAPVKAPELKAPEMKPAEEAAKPQEAAKAPEPKPLEAPKAAEEKPAEKAAQAPAAKPAAPPKPAPAKKPVVEPVPEPSFMEELLGNPVYVAGGGAVLIGGLLAALWAVGRRRKKALASFEDSIMTGGDLKANTVFGNTGGGQIDTGDTSFLTDFSQGGMGAIDTHDVDPIAEAEVYMAYGRDAQAEEILKEALNKDPNRHDVQLKLLEIYAGRRNKEAFETVATELYAATGGQGPIWEKAAELGRGLDPDNPLYAGGGASAAPVAAAGAAAAAARTPSVDVTLDLEAESGVPLDQATVPSGLDTEVPLEFDLDTIAPAAPALQEAAGEGEKPEAAAAAEGTLEFDLDTIIPKAVEKQEGASTTEAPLSLELPELSLVTESQPQPGEGEPAKSAGTTEGLDFHFEIETPSEPTPAAAPPVAESAEALMPELDLSGIELEMPGEMTRELAAAPEGPATVPLEEAPTVAGQPDAWEEASTKLDLARAYLEMGDKEGAREILEEVVQEGGPEQQADARKLLATLA